MGKMGKYKSFIIGVVLGSFMVSAVGYASGGLQITVNFPKISYWLDGKQLSLGKDKTGEMALNRIPDTIQYQGRNYVSARKFAEALGKDVFWEEKQNKFVMFSAQDVTYKAVQLGDASDDVKKWVENSRKIEGIQQASFNGHYYLLVTRGEVPSGGYGVKIESIKKSVDYDEVHIDFTNPPKGYASIQPIEYPYVLVELDQPLKETIRIFDNTNHAIPQIRDFESKPSLSQYSRNLAVFSPVASDGKIELDGLARDFEGIVYYKRLTPDGKVVEQGVLQAQGADPNWGYFKKSWALSDVSPGETVELHSVIAAQQDAPASRSIKVVLRENS